jgi:hypothetical protein
MIIHKLVKPACTTGTKLVVGRLIWATGTSETLLVKVEIDEALLAAWFDRDWAITGEGAHTGITPEEEYENDD